MPRVSSADLTKVETWIREATVVITRASSELRERDLDTEALAREIRQHPGWGNFDGTPSSTVGVAVGLLRKGRC